MNAVHGYTFPKVIDEICSLDWNSLSSEEMTYVAWAYYYFSIQFRENLKIARDLYPNDEKLIQLEREECDTDNLSPWPGVVEAGERVNHDEFMRRTLELCPIDAERSRFFAGVGEAYLAETRALDDQARAASIASYEDGGLERVFTAFLQAQAWDTDLLRAFKHFLTMHVQFDSDPDQGHGALSRHIALDDRILPLWRAFKVLLVTCVPALAGGTAMAQGGGEFENLSRSAAE
jgi:hypothetical protein